MGKRPNKIKIFPKTKMHPSVFSRIAVGQAKFLKAVPRISRGAYGNPSAVMNFTQKRTFCQKDSGNSNPQNENPEHSDKASFGFKTVEKEKRQGLVNLVFDSVADSYDVMNDVMSLGVHRVWKDVFVNEIGVLRPYRTYTEEGEIEGKRKTKVLDVAGGTGDIAFKIINKQSQHSRNLVADLEITVFDINDNMLRVGQKRSADLGHDPKLLNFMQGNAEHLEHIADESIDVYTIAFGIRNVTRIDLALKEAHRVLRKGGRFLCLEFSKVQNPMFREFYEKYSMNVIPVMGEVVAGDKESYKY